MILDRVFTHPQHLSDLPVFHTFRNLRNDFVLPPAQQHLAFRVGHQGWQALSESLKNVPGLAVARPHLSAVHATNAFDELAIGFIPLAYTYRTRAESLNGDFT